MKKLSENTIFLILTIFLSLVFTSCGTKVPIIKTESTSTSSLKLSIPKKSTIKIGININDNELLTFQTTINELNFKSNSYKIETENIPVNNYLNRLDSLINDDQAPDLMMMDSIVAYNYMKTGKFLDITEKAENDSFLKLGNYFKGTLNSVKYEGKIYGLPYDCSPTVLYYNADLFDEAGIPYPSENWKWEDFRKYAKLLTKDTDGNGTIDQWGIWPKFVMGWLHIIPSYGGDFNDITSNECMKALKMYVDIINDKAYATNVDSDNPENQPSFHKGNMAMTHSIITKYIVDGIKFNFNFGISPMPYETRKCVHATVNDIMINAKTKYPVESYKALVDLTKALLNGKYIPPTKDGFDLTNINPLGGGFDLKVIQKVLESDFFDTSSLNTEFYFGPAWSIVMRPINDGTKTVDQAMKDMKEYLASSSASGSASGTVLAEK
ncbi:MAG: ABC transporter substrate-binding protein [Saccharofermentanales bacterium]